MGRLQNVPGHSLLWAHQSVGPHICLTVLTPLMWIPALKLHSTFPLMNVFFFFESMLKYIEFLSSCHAIWILREKKTTFYYCWDVHIIKFKPSTLLKLRLVTLSLIVPWLWSCMLSILCRIKQGNFFCSSTQHLVGFNCLVQLTLPLQV